MTARLKTASIVGVAAFLGSFLLRYLLAANGHYPDDLTYMLGISAGCGIAAGIVLMVPLNKK